MAASVDELDDYYYQPLEEYLEHLLLFVAVSVALLVLCPSFCSQRRKDKDD